MNAMNELTRIMNTVGISAQQVEACANDSVVAKAIFETQKAAMSQFGFQTTPTFFIAGIQLDGKKNPELIRPAIEAALKV
jgi:protein-disulfide isomerase